MMLILIVAPKLKKTFRCLTEDDIHQASLYDQGFRFIVTRKMMFGIVYKISTNHIKIVSQQPNQI